MRPSSRSPRARRWRPMSGAASTRPPSTPDSSSRRPARSRRARTRRSSSGSWTRPGSMAATSESWADRLESVARRRETLDAIRARERSRALALSVGLSGRSPAKELPAKRLLGRRDAVGAPIPATAEAAAPAAAGTSAPARAAGTASAPAGAAGPRRGHVHRDLPAIQILAIELGDGALGLFRRRHFHEAEATRLARELVSDHRGRLDRAALSEVFTERFTSCGV